MKGKGLEFRTMNAFEEYYSPKEHKRKMIEKMTPEEYGKYLARKDLKKIKRYIKRILN